MATAKLIDNIRFTRNRDPQVVEIAHQLGQLTQRSTTDGLRTLVLEEGSAKVAELKRQSQEKNDRTAAKNLAAAESAA